MKRILILCIGIGLHYVAGVVFGLGIEQVIAQANRFANYTENGNATSSANRLNIEMIAVQGGTFMMGCTPEQDECNDEVKPANRVTVSDLYIGKYEVTQAQWRAVMGTTLQQQGDKANMRISNVGEGDNYPMYFVSWDDTQEFIRRLNAATGKTYRLLTEAEWEFAARGGNSSRKYKYSGSNTAGDVAWYYDNAGDRILNSGNTMNPNEIISNNINSHPVGRKSPNELGIHDMSGNVWEWCSDWFGLYNSNEQTNPKGPSSGAERILRGGCWVLVAHTTRVSFRFRSNPDKRDYMTGFRLACNPN